MKADRKLIAPPRDYGHRQPRSRPRPFTPSLSFFEQTLSLNKPCRAHPAPLSKWLILLLAAACALLIANLYFAQPIADLIAADFGIERSRVGLLSTLPLAGYGVGLLVIAPLGDLYENRRLITAMMAIVTLMLFLLWIAHWEWLFLAESFVAGLAASTIQVIVPYASHLLPPARQGKGVSRLVSGVMLGIMLARPAASFVAEASTWRSIYFLAAVLMAVMTVTLRTLLPPRRPSNRGTYWGTMASLAGILRRTAILRRRGTYQAAMFGCFITFWTSVPLWLAGSPFHLTQGGIAWVAMAGVAGAIAPPFATRLVDRGHSRLGTFAAMGTVIVAFLITLALPSLPGVIAGAVLIDAAITANMVIGQRAIFALAPEQRSRMNALYIAMFFAGGAVASAASAWCFARSGWPGVVGLGGGIALAALLYSFTEPAAVRSSAA